jgi:hypothetical protein
LSFCCCAEEFNKIIFCGFELRFLGAGWCGRIGLPRADAARAEVAPRRLALP